MMIYGYISKSKAKKLSKAQQEQKDEFARAIENISKKKYSSSNKPIKTIIVKPTVFRRETPIHNSLDTGFIPCTKAIDNNKYTGQKMKGVATMHKSNAVPVFTDNEAKEISSMRR